jgi:CYTH domain-containing protein
VEFASEAASERFAPPGWMGRELTGDGRWANRALATAGRPDAG